MIEKLQKPPLIVASLTSYPPRISTLRPCLKSLLDQNLSFDKIVLYLSKDEFVHEREDLPTWLSDMEQGITPLEVEFRENNLMSHKKWFYVFSEYPHDTIVLLDDDIIYPPDMLSNLLEYHRLFPECVISRRSHLITKEENGTIKPYLEWIHTAAQEDPTLIGCPRLDLFATTGAGTLLFPGFASKLPDIAFDEIEIMKACPHADDLWLKLGQIAAGIPVVTSTDTQTMNTCTGSQSVRLADYNKHSGGNDTQLAQARPLFENLMGKTLEEMIWGSQIAGSFSIIKNEQVRNDF